MIVRMAAVVALALSFVSQAAWPAAANADLRCGGVRLGKRVVVARDDARCPWLFKSERVQLGCIGKPSAGVYVLSAGGADYALNGNARDAAAEIGLKAIGDITTSRQANVSEWIAAARQACQP